MLEPTDKEPGWFPDPDGSAATERFWNGSQWTESRREVPPSMPAPVNEPRAKQSFCTNCGAHLGAPTPNFCHQCGHRIGLPEPARTSHSPPSTQGRARTTPPRSLNNRTIWIAVFAAAFAVIAITLVAVSGRNNESAQLTNSERKALVAYFVGLGDSYIGETAKEGLCVSVYEGFVSTTTDPDVFWRDMAQYAQTDVISPSEVRQALAGLCRPYTDTSYQGNAKDASTAQE